MRDDMAFLYESLQGRRRPEDVLIRVNALPAVRQALPNLMALVPSHALRWMEYGYSLMPGEFDAPIPPRKRMRTLWLRSDHSPLEVSERDLGDPAVLRGLLNLIWAELNVLTPNGPLSWRDRPSRAMRRRLEGMLPRRAFNRAYRLALQIEKEVGDYEHQLVRFQLGRVAKTNYASQLPESEFRKDELTAAFVAYMTANLARRSQFTVGRQARALDEAAARLLAALRYRPETNWLAVAYAHPSPEVLEHLYIQSPEGVATVLGLALETMRVAGLELRSVGTLPGVDLDAMVVRRGIDSSGWNAAAGAWNKARQVWMSAMQALGREDALDNFMPGKVMRLMAADVARWHRSSGGGIDPDTRVWAILPKPWDVLFGNADCPRVRVVRACQMVGVDSITSGWQSARSMTQVQPWQPTPDSVHGVAVADPALAVWLRKIGVFSGQSIRREQVEAFQAKYGEQAAFVVRRQLEKDGFGYAVGADWSDAPIPTKR